MSRRLASGTRTGLAIDGGPSATGDDSGAAAGPRAPIATCPTSDVVVDVVRRSLLRSRYIVKPVVNR